MIETADSRNKLEIALREYEAAHKQWMNTPVWSNTEVAEQLKQARERYLQEYRAAHPNYICF